MPDTPLSAARYVSLATFRKSGAAVATPVWAAVDADGNGDNYYVFSAGDAGKVKRLRNSANARLAECDVRGNVLGPWRPARGRILTEPDEISRALATLRGKYGWQMALTDFFARLSGRFHRRAWLEITVMAPDAKAG